MKFKTIIAGIAFVGYLGSCNTSNNKKNQTERFVDEKIILDGKKKWKVVPDMLQYIQNMEIAIVNFETSELKDYTKLASIIDINIRSLTTNCTMKGQSHDELHKWLVPFIHLSEEFDVAESIEKQEEIYQKFKVSFVVFNTYFE